ncbi:hypothetical protein NODU109028_06725 [Nocardioides dubius]
MISRSAGPDRPAPNPPVDSAHGRSESAQTGEMLPTADQPAGDLTAHRPALRLAVHRLRSAHRGRSFAWTLHLGSLDGEQVAFSLAGRPSADPALCLDAACALAARCVEPSPWIWITRPGDAEVRCSDLAWLRAAWLASHDLGLSPTGALLLTKEGWSAPFTGEQARWKRLRLRPPQAHSAQACTGSLECISSR